MMKRLNVIPTNINIKWKLTLWAAFLMIFLFLSYNILQYFVIQNWVITQERHTIQKKMDEVTAYLLESGPEKSVSESETYLDVLNEKYQMIRVVNEDDSILFTISDQVPENWVKPKQVSKEELVEISPHDDRILIYRKPVDIYGFQGTVEIVRNLENFDTLINQILMLIFVTGFVAIILSLFGGRLITLQLLRPINSMISTMRMIKENGLKERVPIKRQQDEMTELGMMFNELMDNLEKSFQQQQQFVEDASHELKTPLAVIHGHLSLIKRRGKEHPEVLERSIELSLNETNRLIHLVSDLLTLSRVEEYEPPLTMREEIRIKSTIESVVENFKVIRNDFQILYTVDMNNETTLNMLKRHFEQIIIILLDNAIKYSNHIKAIEINVKELDRSVKIEVTDFGIGISSEELPFVLNRFYRVDKARSRKDGGNGLGLSIAKKLIDMYDGEIEIDSEYGEWTKVTVTFPIK